MRILGCDPGAHTGLVLVEVPENWDIMGAKILAARVVSSRTSPDTPRSQTDRKYFEELRETIAAWAPHVAVVEDPSDAAEYWGARGREGKKTARGSMYRLGVYKGMLTSVLFPIVGAIAEYQVDGDRKKIGWMKADHGTKKLALIRMAALAGQLGGPCPHTEHILMALGVLAHHCRHFHSLAMEMKLRRQLSEYEETERNVRLSISITQRQGLTP